MRNNLSKKFTDFVSRKSLFTTDDKLLLAFSGGADSVCLVDLLLHAGFRPVLAHVNFNLRGADADADQKFCEKFALIHGLTIHTASFDTASYAQEYKLSIEEAARKLRYEEFERLADEFSYTRILTAHHADDSIETFLINFLSGTGIRGLTGIKALNGRVVRPLLFTDKASILAYCNERKLDFRTDRSNWDERFVRNKLRHRVLPVLKEINPSLPETALRNFEILSETEQLYRQAVDAARAKVCRTSSNGLLIDIAVLKNMPAAKTILHEILFPYGFSPSVLETILKAGDAEAGRRFYSDTHLLLKDRDVYELRSLPKDFFESILIDSPESPNWEKLGLKAEILPREKISKNDYREEIALIDYDKVEFPIEFRSVKEGDKFRPLGMKGKKLLSNYFIDRKYSYFQKKEARVICSAGKIVWLVGKRLDDDFKLGASSKHVLKITFV